MIRLASASISFDGFGNHDFVNTFAQAGFRYIEFNCWYPSTLTPAKMRQLRRRCEACGRLRRGNARRADEGCLP